MSKAHSRGRIDKGGHNHGYYNRNSTGEEKRPSVFDRLGTRTRRENTSSGSHYSAVAESPVGGYKSKTDPLKSHAHTQRQGHSSTKREGGHQRSRSRSGSPRVKKKSTQSGVTHHRSKSKGPIKSLGTREKEKVSGRKTSPKRVGSGKSKTKTLQSSKSRSNNRTSSKKSKVATGKGKIRSSSLSSEGSTSRGSTSTSSTHTRTTSSTATEASSTSSTAITSTTESSAPSIKLKPARKEKQKKKMKKKSRVSVSMEKSRHSEVPIKRQSVSSSVSSRDSRKESHHYKDISRNKVSSGNWHKSPSRLSYEGKSFSKDGRTSGREKEQQQGRNFEHVSRTKERQTIDDDSRKRRLSDDAYGGSTDGNYVGHKRSRTVPSPPPKYNKANLGRRSRTPSPRRIPPDPSSVPHKFMTRRERTPPIRSASKERLRIIRSPHRRPSFEEHHRRPDTSRKERSHVPVYNAKVVKEMDRERERPFGHPPPHVGPGAYEKPGYPPRDTSRPRDRYAPARPVPAMDRGRIAPKHLEPERNLMGKERQGLKDYEPLRARPPPLLGSGPMAPKPNLIKQNQPIRMSHEDNRPRTGHVLNIKRHAPMIVKTKEALLERYEETIKQSRVDMWVDQTLQGNSRMNVEPFESEKLPPKRVADEVIRTPTPDENKDKCSSIDSLSGINIIESTTKVDAENNEKNLELSDFSDDADDILTQEVALKPLPSVESSSPAKDNQENVIPIPVDSVVNDVQKLSEEVTNSNTELEKDSPPTVVSTSSIPPQISYDDARSLQSHSQTEDDILEQMDFEEISDEELGEVENKISIVDVFGVNWASLLSRDKPEVPSSLSGISSESTTKGVRQRWTSLQVFQQVGISRKLCGEELFQKVVDKVKESLKISDEEDPKQFEHLERELENPLLRRRRLERSNLLENYGLGPHSRALSAKRDMVVRRCLLNLPPKNLISLEFGNQSSGPINAPQEPEFATDLLKLSVSHYKNS